MVRVVEVTQRRTFTPVTEHELSVGNCEAHTKFGAWVDKDMLRLLADEARSRYVTAPPEKRLEFWLAVRLTLNEHHIYDSHSDKKRKRYKAAIFKIYRARAEKHRQAQARLRVPKQNRGKRPQVIPVVLEQNGQYGLVI